MVGSKAVKSAGNDASKVVLRMNDEIEHFHKGNSVTRKDAELCLQEYAPKFKWWKNKARILDVGSGDGSVTKILSKFLPADYEVLVGADINPKAIKFATNKYGTDKIKFRVLNIEGEIPDDMKNSFDHVFSFFTFHWVDDHEKAFTNIYNILEKNGEFFSIFLTFSDLYFIFEMLSKRNKWATWMKDFYKFPSPYYNVEDPDVYVSKMLNKIGYKVLDVRCKQRLHNYESIEIIKELVTAINPFNIPKDMWPDFLNDFIEVQRYMDIIDDTTGEVQSRYTLILIHCTK